MIKSATAPSHWIVAQRTVWPQAAVMMTVAWRKQVNDVPLVQRHGTLARHDDVESDRERSRDIVGRFGAARINYLTMASLAAVPS
jgi:hypothetical protein